MTSSEVSSKGNHMDAFSLSTFSDKNDAVGDSRALHVVSGAGKVEADMALYKELWRACAGPLVSVPQENELVFYFPQGHIEQVEASTNQVAEQQMPVYNLPSKILCLVVNVQLRAELETDEVFAQITLMPEHDGMRFDLKTGATKCITEDIKINAMTVGQYSVVNPAEGFPLSEEDRITVRVTSPLGNNYHFADRKDSGNFAFTAGEAGDYMACFWAAKQTPDKSMSIDFDWKSGLAAKDWSKVAKKGQVEMMELELKKLYDSVTTIHEEMFNLREREEMMQHLIRATNSKMATFSFFSLVICLSVAALQLWHLKAFFQRKKLI